MPDQITWDATPDLSGLQATTPKNVQWDAKPDFSGLQPNNSAPQPTKFEKVTKALTTPLMGEDENEKRDREYSTSVPTLDESAHPLVTGMKKGLAGADADMRKLIRSFTSPIGITTLGLGVIGEVPGAVGTAARALSTAGAVGFGAQGAKQTVEGGKKITKEGFTPENVEDTLQGASQAVLGAAGAAAEAKPAIERATPVIKGAVERMSTPKNLVTVGAGAIPGIGHVAGPVMGRYLAEPLFGKAANKPLIKFNNPVPPEVSQSAALGDLAIPETKPAAQTGEALGRIPKMSTVSAIPPVEVYRDATRENVPFAGEETEEAIPRRTTASVYRDATRQNVPYAGEDIIDPDKQITSSEVDKSRAMRLPGEPKPPESELPRMDVPTQRPAEENGEFTAKDDFMKRLDQLHKTEPIKLKTDKAGNVLEGDGRHRVIEAQKLGIKRVPVIHEVNGKVMDTYADTDLLAKKMGVTEESLADTDDQQQGFRGKNLSDSEQRALEHRIGKEAASDQTEQGVVRAQRLLKATNQNLADFANEYGPAYPGDPMRSWEAKDFSRAGTGKKTLNPMKQYVFDHIRESVPHDEFLRGSSEWGAKVQ